MNAHKIKSGIYWMGAIDWDRRLFDSLIPLPDGTSYNAYLVRGSKKTALIDTADPTKERIFLEQFKNLPQSKPDYIICQHVEQDHSGLIPHVLKMFPEAKVLCSSKAKQMIVEHLAVPEDTIEIVNDGSTIDLGGRTLKFIYTPWVHWPETMCTYLAEDKILFTCDFFGSHLATSDLFVSDEGLVYEAAKRYYAEIMMPFRTVIRGNLEKIKPLDFEIIAPSHGPLYNKPEFILNAYRDWVLGPCKNEVVIAFVTTHYSTQLMVEALIDALAECCITVKPFNLPVTDIGQLAIALVDAATLIVASPTIHVGLHPLAMYAAALVNSLRPKLKHVGFMGSYGWSSKAVEQVSALLPNIKAEFLEPIIAKGLPTQDDFKAIEQLAIKIADKHKAEGILKINGGNGSV